LGFTFIFVALGLFLPEREGEQGVRIAMITFAEILMVLKCTFLEKRPIFDLR
jgi:hypothetical protein